MAKKNILNYKKIYINKLPYKWNSKNFEIHHIDGNHDNNDFSNLLLIPSKLHKQYHYWHGKLYPILEDMMHIAGFQCGLYCKEEFLSVYLELKRDMFLFSNLKYTLEHGMNFPEGTDFESILRHLNFGLYTKYIKEVV